MEFDLPVGEKVIVTTYKAGVKLDKKVYVVASNKRILIKLSNGLRFRKDSGKSLNKDRQNGLTFVAEVATPELLKEMHDERERKNIIRSIEEIGIRRLSLKQARKLLTWVKEKES